jgi:isoleucyl-tRNA synthetase
MKYSHSKTMAVYDACVEAGAGVFIKVTQSESEKCVRCWHHREDIGGNNEHPELCSRCSASNDEPMILS